LHRPKRSYTMIYGREKCWSVAMVLMLSAMLPGCGANYRGQDDNVGHAPDASSNKQPPAMAFGKQAWKHYFGDVGEAPALPDGIEKLLDSTCPFWPDKKVKETHLLVLIPAIVNDEPFTLDLLASLVRSPKQGYSASYTADYGSSTVQTHFGQTRPHTNAYWVLMTRDVVGLGNSSKGLQKKYPEYNAPTILEAATAILTNRVRSGQWLYKTTHTYCQENTTSTRKGTAQTIFVGKSSKTDQLEIGHKIVTVIRFASSKAADIPSPARGIALLRRL